LRKELPYLRNLEWLNVKSFKCAISWNVSEKKIYKRFICETNWPMYFRNLEWFNAKRAHELNELKRALIESHYSLKIMSLS
jgi:hypothetical protein